MTCVLQPRSRVADPVSHPAAPAQDGRSGPGAPVVCSGRRYLVLAAVPGVTGVAEGGGADTTLVGPTAVTPCSALSATSASLKSDIAKPWSPGLSIPVISSLVAWMTDVPA